MNLDKEQRQDQATMLERMDPLEDSEEWITTSEWIQTYTGRKFILEKPTIEMIHTLDIAHSLSQLCRYTGHVQRFYSVAEHSVLLSRHAVKNVLPMMARTLLFHDASEAYIGDISRPFKNLLPKAKEIEERVQALIAEKYHLYWPFPMEVHDLDSRMLLDEKAVLMHTLGGWDLRGRQPIGNMPIEGWNPERAEREFLLRAAELGI